MPELSVILPVKNGEKYIHAAIASCLRGMPRDSQLVVLDDGSVDGTLSVLDRVNDSRLLIIQRAKSAGLASALNHLIEHTDSRYIARMDADDISLPWRFAIEISAMKRGIDFCFGSVLHRRERSPVLRPSRFDRLTDETLKLLFLIENPVAHSTAMFRRTAIHQLGGYRGVLSEDYDLWLRGLNDGYRFERVASPVLIYRHHQSQVTASEHWQRESRVEAPLVDSHSKLAERLVGVQGDTMTALRTNRATVTQQSATLRLLDEIEAQVALVSHRRGGARVVSKVQKLRKRLEAGQQSPESRE